MTVAIVLIVAVAAFYARRAWSGRSRGHRPNVLLITIDTLRWDHVGCYGAAQAATPVLDALAARGVRFETAIAHAPLTAPSHASILTGLTPVRHGVHDNGAFVLAPDIPRIATMMHAAGYATAAFVSGFPLDRRFGFASGFDLYDDRLPRGNAPRGAGETERKADATTARVLDWWPRPRASADAASAGRPWFVWVHYFDPHAAYDPPDEYRRRFAANPYDGEVAFVDAQIGRLFARLTGIDRLDDTIVLVTADHGESLGDHGEETHGVFVYDATLRVPWIVAGARVPAGRVVQTVARGVDVVPTLLDLAGVQIPAGLDGRSLRAALDGRAMSDEPAYVESLLASRNFGWAALRGLRDARWKYIAAPRAELYDVAQDPRESANQIERQPERVRSMSRDLDAALRAPARSAARPVDAEAAGRLRALGYVTGTGSPRGDGGGGRDPKDAIALINRLERAIADTRVDPARAATELRGVLAEDPGIVIAHRQLAVALSAAGDHRGAIAEIEALRSRDLATAEDLVLLSESLRVTGRREEAARAIEAAARLDPQSPEPALTEARALASEGHPAEAAGAYRRALDLAPDNAEALVGLGQAALVQGDVESAAAAFERVLSRDSGDVAARTGLGLVRGRQGRMDDAIALLQQVVRDSPANAEALAGLGAALARSGAPRQAVPYFERAVAAGLRTTPVLNGLGFARLETGDRAGALAALRESLSVQPAQPAIQQAVRDLAAGNDPSIRK